MNGSKGLRRSYFIIAMMIINLIQKLVSAQSMCPVGQYNKATETCVNCNPYTCYYDCSYSDCYKCGFLWLSTCCEKVSRTCSDTCYKSCCSISYSCQNCPMGSNCSYISTVPFYNFYSCQHIGTSSYVGAMVCCAAGTYATEKASSCSTCSAGN